MSFSSSFMLNILIARLSVSQTCKGRSHLGLLHHNASQIFKSFSSVVKFSESAQPNQKQDGNESFAVSYLINSCGMSPKVAVEVSKRFKLEDPDKPDRVLNLFRSYGLSETQISKAVKRDPRLLLCNPETILLPKIRFFQSIGFSSSELPELLSSSSVLLFRSSEKYLIPFYEALKNVLDNDDEKVKMALKRTRFFIPQDLTNAVQNIKVLREHGVPQSSVTRLVTNFSNVAFMDPAKFAEHVNFAKEIGIEPFRQTFLQAVHVLALIKKSNWESKLDFFERCGWSRDVTISVFRKYPYCMILSEVKISTSMKFLVDEIGLFLDDIATYPALLGYSLRQRIIPRWSVVKTLRMNGLLNKDMPQVNLFQISEKKFLEEFVSRFLESVPQLLNIYKDSMPSVPRVP